MSLAEELLADLEDNDQDIEDDQTQEIFKVPEIPNHIPMEEGIKIIFLLTYLCYH